ncbi:MAG: DNA-directed RNA polymerase subunit alpha [Candidatus Marinimicrobia bacterium]|nr:DNA-directed RNA polymerase subunit alpha [Candidatus Neomarinimicrobiota bacterium]MDD5581837.1 DNA-directed RNA polymerase subunit alpha [Candidatus Neomarinimicrobiota bacterium]
MPNFQIPEKVKIDETAKNERFARFILEPLERGFGITVGNALRRVLLSSIPGSAITALRIEGILHEFSSIDGVIEDVTLIILNLKKVRVLLPNSKPIKLSLKLQGPADIKAGMLNGGNPDVEIMNPDQHIMTIEEEKNINLDLWFGRGRGYASAENNKTADAPLDTIWIDSIFSPIVKVNYYAEKLQSGVKEDLERLVLEITTDGTMTPEDAISYSSKLLTDHFKPFFALQETDVIEPEKQIDEDKMRIRKQLMRSIDELELSVRSYNCLQAADIKTIADLVSKEENEMLRFKNFGRKSLNELIEKLDELGLRFGMDVSEYIKDASKK